LKNAYAHAFDASGRLWITEVADDPVNEMAPPDELNLWAQRADFGWPKCFGVQQPAANYGGDTAYCATTRPAVALFPPHATPTSVVPSPWEEDVLLVALWVQGVVVRVPVSFGDDNATGVPETFIAGMQNPQHLLVLDDNTLLVSDFTTGEIYRIEQR
jgi:glucose/arabinose dehydrogenase